MASFLSPAASSTFIGCESPYAEADIVLFGAPYDGTASYRPGTRFGPSAIRSESYGIETYSPYQDADLADLRVCDAGDVEAPFGAPDPLLALVEEQAARIWDDGKTPLLLGGEHLVTLGAVRAAAARFPDLHIVHFDAHADLRPDYLGAPLSHACVIRRCHDLLGDGRIHQFGIRSGDRDEFAFMRAGHTDAHPFSLADTASLRLPADVPVYFTIDLDVLDPAEFPGTGTPEAGGARFGELLAAVENVFRAARVVGMDAVELSPPCDPTGASTALACKFVREAILRLSTNRKEHIACPPSS